MTNSVFFFGFFLHSKHSICIRIEPFSFPPPLFFYTKNEKEHACNAGCIAFDTKEGCKGGPPCSTYATLEVVFWIELSKRACSFLFLVYIDRLGCRTGWGCVDDEAYDR